MYPLSETLPPLCPGTEPLYAARQRNWHAFRRLLSGSGAERAPDYLLVTTAHEGQAAGCREEILARQRDQGLVPSRTQCLVISDPAGQRVGNGGASLLALAEMSRRALGRSPHSVEDFRQAFRGKRVLLIHSGGDSRRLPHESPLGKAFSPLPALSPMGGPLGVFRETWTAFDELFVGLSVLLSRLREGLIIAAGDVVLLFDAGSVPFRGGVMGLACPAPAALGERHGVFHLSQEGSLLGYLQKPSRRTMEEAGLVRREPVPAPENPLGAPAPASAGPSAATAGEGRDLRGSAEVVDLDTGIICLDAEAAAGLAGLGMEIAFSPGGSEPLDLYRHLLPTLAVPPRERTGLPAGWPKRVAAEFSTTRLAAHRLSPGSFAHLSTSRAFTQAFDRGIPGLTPSPRPGHYASRLGDGGLLRCRCGSRLRLTPERGARPPATDGPSPPAPHEEATAASEPLPAQPHCETGGAVLIGSRADGCSQRAGAGAVLEWCDLRGDWSVGEGALACDLRRPEVPFALRPGTVAHRIPVVLPGPSAADGLSVLRLYGIGDDPKLPATPDGGATLFGTPLLEWLAARRIAPDTVWPGVPEGERSLWNAHLYPAALPPEDLRLTLWMQEPEPPSEELLRRWLGAPRLSLEQCFHVVDTAALRRQRQDLLERIELASWAELLSADVPSDDLLAAASLRDLAPGRSPLERLLASNHDPLLGARICRVLADFHRKLADVRRPMSERSALPRTGLRQRAVELEVEAFVHVAEAVRSTWQPTATHLCLAPGEEATAASPARLDFGGGWSDTPPYSLERGGVVLNAAVFLEGRAPIVATVRALRRLELRLTARDLGKTRVLDSLAEATAYGDPSNPFALHKAALVYAGLLPERGRTLKQELKRLGGGIEVITESRVPKGSGLGTSSILAATLLQALWTAVGVRGTPGDLFEGVLAIEQMLTTGGGWQDQIGGVVPGIKLIRTQPGIPQTPVLEPLHLPEDAREALRERLVLFYTGQRRLARNILRNVMGGYLGRVPHVCRVLHDIKEIALQMRQALLESDLEAFGSLMTRHWELNKLMDPHSSNAYIESLFAAAAPYLSGGKLVGAGGGGFMELVARSPEEVPALRRTLESAGARFYAYSIDDEGLRVRQSRSEERAAALSP